MNNLIYQHVVSLDCPHDSRAVRAWLHANGMPFIYTTYNIPRTIEYKMATAADALLFRLRWL